MAEMIGRTKSWLAWFAGAVMALVFGGSGCGRDGGQQQPVYGGPPARPVQPPAPAQPPAGRTIPAQSDAGLEESADWKVIAEAWDFAMPFARSGKSTTAQRKEIDARLAAAREAGARLVKAGLLSAREASLLASEADKAVADIRRDPPVGVLCYEVASIPAVQRLSFRSIAERLPATEVLIKEGKVQPAAIGKVLEAIEADLVTLADEKRRAELGDRTSKEEADKLRAELTAQVARLKASLLLRPRPPTKPMCYDVPMLPEPKPQSARELDERLALLERAERSGRLATPTAEKARSRILADQAEAD
ncbi:MAG TPA: hypothetical protein PK280_02705 [Planctomycetota bacterium]|nr:hypothetical protein [Planctomycetota bacterium]